MELLATHHSRKFSVVTNISHNDKWFHNGVKYNINKYRTIQLLYLTVALTYNFNKQLPQTRFYDYYYLQVGYKIIILLFSDIFIVYMNSFSMSLLMIIDNDSFMFN